MANLKPAYDAAVAADGKVNAILVQMSAALEKGTEEGTQEALALRPDLEAAKAEAEQANALYVQMRDAGASSDEHARLFVPVNETAQSDGKKTMTRAEYEQLTGEEKHRFIVDEKGQLVDELPEA